jgi:hypothetical protein
VRFALQASTPIPNPYPNPNPDPKNLTLGQDQPDLISPISPYISSLSPCPAGKYTGKTNQTECSNCSVFNWCAALILTLALALALTSTLNLALILILSRVQLVR